MGGGGEGGMEVGEEGDYMPIATLSLEGGCQLQALVYDSFPL